MSTTTENTKPTDFLRVSDLTSTQFEGLLNLAARMKIEPQEWNHQLSARTLACFFEKPSTRTRVSFEAAAYRLGMLPIMLRPDELQLGRGELIADTARVLASFTAGLVIRTFAQSTLEEFAEAASVPVINALSDEHHPCQALADLLSLREHYGSLDGLKLTYVGDGDNVAHSLMEAGALMGMHVVIGCPETHRPNPGIESTSSALAASHGGTVNILTDPREAVRDADAVYTDVWVSMGEEAEREARMRELAPYQVNAGLMALAKPHAVFMHCLPAHRGLEVTAEVIDGPMSIVWQQAADRLPTEQAVLYSFITGDWKLKW